MSNENADALASQLKALEAGKNPFPANLLSVAPTPVNCTSYSKCPDSVSSPAPIKSSDYFIDTFRA